MNRQQLIRHIREAYGAQGDTPWMEYPQDVVFRHGHNKKWFALLMQVEGRKLGLSQDGPVDALNLKCPPLLVGSLRQQSGFRPAYHMNKNHWITVILDGQADEDQIKWLISLSYDLTKGKK